MFALRQSAGRVPWFREAWYSSVTAGVISTAVSFSTLVGISSGPVALLGLIPFNSFSTPLVLIIMSGRVGNGLGPISGRGPSGSLVNTEENCSFSMLACMLLSLCISPSRLSGDTPTLSFFFDFTYDHSFFFVPSTASVMSEFT